MVEIGLPFSDPLADGPTIQESSRIALHNGMTTRKLFEHLSGIREKISIPMLIMGYFNPILQYGVEAFARDCKRIGIDGLIIPDLPLEEYLLKYKDVFDRNDLLCIFLVTPQTPKERIRKIDEASEGFLYLVSSAGVTGGTREFTQLQEEYFKTISEMKLRNPLITGFGIHDSKTFRDATEYTNGAIVGSAFIKHLREKGVKGIKNFVHGLRRDRNV